MLVYFAAPLFSAAERRFNAALTERIEALGYAVFLPQRNGAERDRPPYDRLASPAPTTTPTGSRLDRNRMTTDADTYRIAVTSSALAGTW